MSSKHFICIPSASTFIMFPHYYHPPMELEQIQSMQIHMVACWTGPDRSTFVIGHTRRP